MHGEVVASAMVSDDICGEAVATIGWADGGIDTGVVGSGFLACCGAWFQTINSDHHQYLKIYIEIHFLKKKMFFSNSVQRGSFPL